LRNIRKECKLGDIITSNPRSISKDYPHQLIQYLDTGSITHGKIEGYQEFSLDEAPSRAQRLVKEGNIVYSLVRPIQRHYGYIVNPPENLVVSTGFSVIDVDKKEADPKFIYYFLTSDEIVEVLDIIAEASTSAYPSLRPTDIEKLDILLPSLPEQRSIAAILSSLDDKIDLLHRQNKTLESIAESYWRKMFVEEVNPNWKRGNIGDLIELCYGKGLKEEKRIAGKYPVVGSNGIVGYHNEFLVKGPGVVIGRKGTLGEVHYIEDNYFPIDTTFFIKSKTNEGKLFFEHFLLKKFAFEEINSDSAVPGLNRKIAESMEVVIPEHESILIFNNFCEPLFIKKLKNVNQICCLSHLRDALLPKLMLGEIDISDGIQDKSFVYPELQQMATKASDEFVEAILISQLVHKTDTSRYPLGRFRYNKLAYFAHRKAGDNVNDIYLKKAAGPYSPWAKYKGPESIAVKNGYVKLANNSDNPGLLPGNKVADIGRYINRYPSVLAVDWVIDNFRYKKNEELELLSTVDYAMQDLARNKKDINMNSVKDIIASHKEWAPKLDRTTFSDENITKAISDLQSLLFQK